jgi:pimeloyl-ACP methyl ester carboxylesterase
MRPATRYARSGDLSIAYQVVGEPGNGLDLVYVPGWVSNIDVMWEHPRMEAFLNRLASFSRLILFDKRGTGLSDRVPNDRLPTLEERMDDLRAVLDAVGSERAAIFGHSEGGNMSVLFAATYPARTVALVTFSIYAKRRWAPDYPWAPKTDDREAWYEELERTWVGEDEVLYLAPSAAGDQPFIDWMVRYLRASASPGAAVALAKMNTEIDVREVLPSIQAPTLVMQRQGDNDVHIEEARYIASRIPGARLLELEGDDHVPWIGNSDTVLDAIEEFLTGERRAPEPDRVLATVLFTDIVGSTERAAAVGDHRWRELLQQHHAAVRRSLDRHRGREVDTAGDGFFATFDGPARAVRAGLDAIDGVRGLGLEIRAGVHTGEVEVMGEGLGGIAVHIGARVAAMAGAGEVLVSSTVKDLVAGSGLTFDDRGERTLKGVPGTWHVYAARA